MNKQQQQQQQHHLPFMPLPVQKFHLQQQHSSSMALMSSGEYVNFNSVNIEPTKSTSLSSSLALTTTTTTAAMTIPLELPTPPLSDTLMAFPTSPLPPTTISTTTITATPTYETMGVMTSSFKTPLLPMPTLDDIEGCVFQQKQQQQQQQQQQHMQSIVTTRTSEPAQYIPVGILKYPTTTTTTIETTIMPKSTVELNLPLSLGAVYTSSTVISHDDVLPSSTATIITTKPTTATTNTTESTPTETIGAVRHKYSTTSKASSMAEISTNDVYNGVATKSTTMTTGVHNLRLKTAPSSSSSTTKLHEKTNGCCCICVGSNRNNTNSSSDAKARKSKQLSQTLWSAFITNVGICTLLLAYTFLGKY